MLQTLLRGWKSSDWSKAADFLSPAFFDVVPTLAMTRIAGLLTKNALDASYYLKVQSLWAPRLRQWQPEVEFSKSVSSAPTTISTGSLRGATVLKLYFASLLYEGPCFLDLRCGQFAETTPSHINWCPKPWIFDFSRDFRRDLINVYRGFYGNQPALFNKGLQSLGLEHSEGLFLKIFGSVKSEPMMFNLTDFRENFHQIFVACKQHKTTLHPEFLPLGLLLFSLYEHAEILGVPLNPAASWHDLSKDHIWSNSESS